MSGDSNVMPYGSDDERNSLIDDDGVMHPPGTFDGDTDFFDHGDTPAYRRTGITDTIAAGPAWHDNPARRTMHGEHGFIHIDVPSVHADAFDADDANRPVNGLGTYHESDGAW